MILKKLHLKNIQNLKELNPILSGLPNAIYLLECQGQDHQLWLIFIPKRPAKMPAVNLKGNLIATGVLNQKLYNFFFL